MRPSRVPPSKLYNVWKCWIVLIEVAYLHYTRTRTSTVRILLLIVHPFFSHWYYFLRVPSNIDWKTWHTLFRSWDMICFNAPLEVWYFKDWRVRVVHTTKLSFYFLRHLIVHNPCHAIKTFVLVSLPFRKLLIAHAVCCCWHYWRQPSHLKNWSCFYLTDGDNLKSDNVDASPLSLQLQTLSVCDEPAAPE